jgi:hypothetical protein
MIPGAYERTMDAPTIADREREGGGAPCQPLRKVHMQPPTGPALRGTEDKSSWLTESFQWLQILRLARR